MLYRYLQADHTVGKRFEASLNPPSSLVNAEELVSKHIVSVKTKIPAERQTRVEEIAIYRRC